MRLPPHETDLTESPTIGEKGVPCRQELCMKISRGALRSSVGLLLTLGSFGCGSWRLYTTLSRVTLLLRTRS
jgi:hypothetical protein